MENESNGGLSEARSHRAARVSETDSTPLPAWLKKQPHPSLRCAGCGSAEVSALPAFSVGSGIAFRPIADDLYCRRCGHIGPPQ